MSKQYLEALASRIDTLEKRVAIQEAIEKKVGGTHWGYFTRATDVATSTGTTYTITWETAEYDPDSMWISGPNVYPQYKGLYIVIGEIEWAPGTVSTCQTMITKNTSLIAQQKITLDPNVAIIVRTPVIYSYNGDTDYINVQGRQTSGSTVNIQNARLMVGLIN